MKSKIILPASLAFFVSGFVAVPAVIVESFAGPRLQDRCVLFFFDPTIARKLGIVVTVGKTKQMIPFMPDRADLPARYAGAKFKTSAKMKQDFGFGKINDTDPLFSTTPQTVVYMLTTESAMKTGLTDQMIGDTAVYIVSQGVSADTIGKIFKKKATDNLNKQDLAFFFASDTLELDGTTSKIDLPMAAGARAQAGRHNSAAHT